LCESPPSWDELLFDQSLVMLLQQSLQHWLTSLQPQDCGQLMSLLFE
jgi:hypothetical protein